MARNGAAALALMCAAATTWRGVAGAGSKQCALNEVMPSIQRVNAACCVPESNCVNGAPQACNGQCAHVFLPFYNRCYSALAASSPKAMDTFDLLAKKCNFRAPAQACLSSSKKMQLLSYLQCATTHKSAAGRGICTNRARDVLNLQTHWSHDPADKCAKFGVSLALISNTADSSGHGHSGTLHGDAFVADGVHFDGTGDYMTLLSGGPRSYQYAKTGTFSISWWITKDACTHSIYEYMFSHSQIPARNSVFSVPTGVRHPKKPNPNIHMYLGCDSNGGGWSSIGGTIMRTNIYDNKGVAVNFDFPLWKTGDFNKVTNRWIHFALTVKGRSIILYNDGVAVPDSSFGFYRIGHTRNKNGMRIPRMCIGNAACNPATGKPTLSKLMAPIGPVTLFTQLFIGGRNDLNKDRHFAGRIAGLMITPSLLTPTMAKCVFLGNEAMLPKVGKCSQLSAEATLSGSLLLDMSFVGSGGTKDTSGHGNKVTAFGGNAVVSTGARFDGKGDYIKVANFDYESDGDFTIAFWFSVSRTDLCKQIKGAQFLYSHMQNASATIWNRKNSNLNVYLTCQSSTNVSTSGASSVPLVVFSTIDTHGTWAMFMYPLLSAGNFDSVTHTWVSVQLTVSRHSLLAYIDGSLVKDAQYRFPADRTCRDMSVRPSCGQLVHDYGCSRDMFAVTGGNPQMKGHNVSAYCARTCSKCGKGGKGGVKKLMVWSSAYPFPSRLRTQLRGFDFKSAITLGARADLQQCFKGAIAGLKIYSSTLSVDEAKCFFTVSELLFEKRH